jgi:uncharacterized protein with GYD domain
MPKYLVEASYTPDGLDGLMKEKASGREAAIHAALATMGGSVEAFYFAFGHRDVVVICDLPDNIAAASLSLAVSSSGLVHATVTPLLTVAEVDKALAKGAGYRPPGA